MYPPIMTFGDLVGILKEKAANEKAKFSNQLGWAHFLCQCALGDETKRSYPFGYIWEAWRSRLRSWINERSLG